MSTHHYHDNLRDKNNVCANVFVKKNCIRQYNVSFICVTLQQIIPHRITKTDEKATPFVSQNSRIENLLVSQNRRIENLLVSQKETGKNL